MDFKDIAPAVTARAAASRTGFHDACGPGIFCNLGTGEDDFPNLRQILRDAGFSGWCRLDQHCDPSDTAARNTAARKATSVKVIALQSCIWPPGGLAGSVVNRKIVGIGHGPGAGGSCVRAGRFAAASPMVAPARAFWAGLRAGHASAAVPQPGLQKARHLLGGAGTLAGPPSLGSVKVAHLHPITEV